MRLQRVLMVAAAVVMLTGAVASQGNKSPEARLRAAMDKETIDGDLKAAIDGYKQVVSQTGASRAIVAQAMLRLGMAYEKQGSAEARKSYDRLVNEFGNQPAVVQQARVRIAAAGTAAASPPALSVHADLYTVGIDLNSGKLTSMPELVPNQPSGASDDPAWSPDGKQLAYVTHEDGSGTFGILSILSWTTGRRREIRDYTQLTRFLWPHWYPDSRLLVAQGVDLKGNDGIYQIDVASGRIEPLLIGEAGTHLSFPTVTPDGRKLIFCRQVGASTGVMLERDLTSGMERRLLEGVNPNTTGMPVLSPDGRYLHYAVLNDVTGESTLSILPLAGGPPRELLRVKQPERIGTGSWTPDSQFILYTKSTARAPKEYWMAPVGGGRPHRVELPEGATRARIHPDGKTVVFLGVAAR